MRIQVQYVASDDWIRVSSVQYGSLEDWQRSGMVLRTIEAWFT
jgi:hypothetical protein